MRGALHAQLSGIFGPKTREWASIVCGRHMERVLVVEDDPQLAHLVITALSTRVIAPMLAINGLDAAQIAPQADLMILDLGLPGLGGLEVIRELREVCPSWW